MRSYVVTYHVPGLGICAERFAAHLAEKAMTNVCRLFHLGERGGKIIGIKRLD